MYNQVKKKHDDIQVPLQFKAKYLVKHNVENQGDQIPFEVEQEIVIAYLQAKILNIEAAHQEQRKEDTIKERYKARQYIQSTIKSFNEQLTLTFKKLDDEF